MWDLERLWQEILKGLRLASPKAGGRIASVGVDGWGVDYVLLDRTGNRIGRSLLLPRRAKPAPDGARL